MKLKDILKEKQEGPSKSFNKLASKFQEEAIKHQNLVEKQKELASRFVKETDSKKRESLKQDILKHHKLVKQQEKMMKSAEEDMMYGLNKEKFDYDSED
jgi:hypothetical protein